MAGISPIINNIRLYPCCLYIHRYGLFHYIHLIVLYLVMILTAYGTNRLVHIKPTICYTEWELSVILFFMFNCNFSVMRFQGGHLRLWGWLLLWSSCILSVWTHGGQHGEPAGSNQVHPPITRLDRNMVQDKESVLFYIHYIHLIN